jgi:hypothetical protein
VYLVPTTVSEFDVSGLLTRNRRLVLPFVKSSHQQGRLVLKRNKIRLLFVAYNNCVTLWVYKTTKLNGEREMILGGIKDIAL